MHLNHKSTIGSGGEKLTSDKEASKLSLEISFETRITISIHLGVGELLQYVPRTPHQKVK